MYSLILDDARNAKNTVSFLDIQKVNVARIVIKDSEE